MPEKQSPYEKFGNFNFGLTAAQQWIPRQIALRGAGWAGQKPLGKPSSKLQLQRWVLHLTETTLPISNR